MHPGEAQLAVPGHRTEVFGDRTSFPFEDTPGDAGLVFACFTTTSPASASTWVLARLLSFEASNLADSLKVARPRPVSGVSNSRTSRLKLCALG